MQQKSLGLIETQGLAAGVVAADAAVKSANVELVGYELTKGGGWTLIKVQGDVGAVKAAVDAARVAAGKVNRVVSTRVIARPSSSLEALIHTPDTVGDQKPEPPKGPEPPSSPTPPQEPEPPAETPPVPEPEGPGEAAEPEEALPEEPDQSLPAEEAAAEPEQQEPQTAEPPVDEEVHSEAPEPVTPPEEGAQAAPSSRRSRKGRNKSSQGNKSV